MNTDGTENGLNPFASNRLRFNPSHDQQHGLYGVPTLIVFLIVSNLQIRFQARLIESMYQWLLECLAFHLLPHERRCIGFF